MNRFIRIVSAAALTLACHAPAFADDSLYAAFGEKAGLRLLVEDLWVRVKADERLAPFFKDTKRDNLVEQLTDQLCQVSGGPCRYEGGKMGPVHGWRRCTARS
jgi:hemoglobin